MSVNVHPVGFLEVQPPKRWSWLRYNWRHSLAMKVRGRGRRWMLARLGNGGLTPSRYSKRGHNTTQTCRNINNNALSDQSSLPSLHSHDGHATFQLDLLATQDYIDLLTQTCLSHLKVRDGCIPAMPVWGKR